MSRTRQALLPNNGYPEFTRWASRPPIGLFQPAYDDTGVLNPANPFAVYLDSFFRRYGRVTWVGVHQPRDTRLDALPVHRDLERK